jgi:hypothetical protein
MPFNGMSDVAPYSINTEYGDGALANFFGTSAGLDATDPFDWGSQQLDVSPETFRSPFVTDALSGDYRSNTGTSKRFGLGASGQPDTQSAGLKDWLDSIPDPRNPSWGSQKEKEAAARAVSSYNWLKVAGIAAGVVILFVGVKALAIPGVS